MTCFLSTRKSAQNSGGWQSCSDQPITTERVGKAQQDERPRHECAAKFLSAHSVWRHAYSSPACRGADNQAHGLVFLRAVTPGCARQRWTWQMSNYDDEAFHSKVGGPKALVRFVSRVLRARAKADHRIQI